MLSILGFVGLFAAFALASLPVHFAPYAHYGPWIFGSYLFWVVPWMLSYALWFARRRAPGAVSVGGGVLEVQRGSATRRIAVDAIASAYSGLELGRPFVDIVLGDGDAFRVRLDEPAAADALVDALGFGPGGRVQTIDLASRKRRLLNLGLGFVAYQLSSMLVVPFVMLSAFLQPHSIAAFEYMIPAVLLVLPFAYRLLKRRAQAPRLEVGDDGVAVVRGRRREVLSRGDVRGAQIFPNVGTVVLATPTGNRVLSGTWLEAAKATAVVRAFERRWQRSPDDQSRAAARAAAFARMGRPLPEWQADVRVRIASTSYRGDALTPDDAEAVLRSDQVPVDARLGAAMALAASGHRVRVAEAARGVVDPQLRDALEDLAEGRDERAAVALPELSRDPRSGYKPSR